MTIIAKEAIPEGAEVVVENGEARGIVTDAEIEKAAILFHCARGITSPWKGQSYTYREAMRNGAKALRDHFAVKHAERLAAVEKERDELKDKIIEIQAMAESSAAVKQAELFYVTQERDELATATANLRSLLKENATGSRERISEIEKERDELQQKIVDLQINAQNLVTAKQLELTCAKRERDELQLKLAELSVHADTLIAAKHQELVYTRGECDDKEKMCEDTTKDFQILVKEYNKLKDERDELKDKIIEIQAEWHNAHDDLRAKLAAATREPDAVTYTADETKERASKFFAACGGYSLKTTMEHLVDAGSRVFRARIYVDDITDEGKDSAK